MKYSKLERLTYTSQQPRNKCRFRYICDIDVQSQLRPLAAAIAMLEVHIENALVVFAEIADALDSPTEVGIWLRFPYSIKVWEVV